MTDFSKLNLAEPLTKALTAEGYKDPTPIQAQAIPIVLRGKDLLGIAQTGTGKTAAFALPILDRLARNPEHLKSKTARVLVLAPTRELAAQIAASFQTYGRHLRLSVVSIFGGVKITKHMRQMERGVDVLVATPGRLLDLVDRKAMHLQGVEVLVLDEADQMLDLGFIHSLRRIASLVPKDRQTLFFSATMPSSILELSKKFLTKPEKVSVAPQSTTAERVTQHVVFTEYNRKQELLAAALQDSDIDRALVFTRTKHGADRVVKKLKAADIHAAAIHGNKSQPQRVAALNAFRAGRCRILVATDIAARGIDIDGVSHVFNFDVPEVAEQYVHRIGRTARAGASGQALSFVSNDERRNFRNIERLIRQKIPALPHDAFDGLAAAAPVVATDAIDPVVEEIETAKASSAQPPRPTSGKKKPNGHRPQRKTAHRKGPSRPRTEGKGKPGGKPRSRNAAKRKGRPARPPRAAVPAE